MDDRLPAGLARAGFSISDGIAQGLTRGVLNGPAFATPFRGVRSLDVPTTRIERAIAFAPLLRPWQAFAGLTALAMLGLPVPWRHDRSTDVEIASDRRRARPERAGVRVVRLPADLLRTHSVDGLRVTAPALTWALLGARCSVHELVVLGDAIVSTASNYPGRRLPGPLATLEQLRGVVDACKGRREVGALRAALPLIRPGVESPKESDMRLFIIGAGMPEPEVQADVYDPADGRLLGRADLLHREARVAEEYEGDGHREKRQWDRDIQKYREFERVGIRVVRATHRDFHPSPDRWLTDLGAVLRSRNPAPPTAP